MSRLREIAERLQAIAAELEGDEAGDERAAELAREAAELSRRGGRGGQPPRARGRAPAERARRRCTRRTCARWSTPPSSGCASPRAAPTAGLEEAMRYSLLAGGKRIRPVLALATARALGADPERFLPGRLRDRADPHLLADPRRPAGDGRRRAAPRPADLARQVRRGRRDPRRRRPLRRGGAALLRAAGRARRGCWRRWRELAARDRRRRHGRRPVRRRDRRPSTTPRACAPCTR